MEPPFAVTVALSQAEQRGIPAVSTRVEQHTSHYLGQCFIALCEVNPLSCLVYFRLYGKPSYDCGTLGRESQAHCKYSVQSMCCRRDMQAPIAITAPQSQNSHAGADVCIEKASAYPASPQMSICCIMHCTHEHSHGWEPHRRESITTVSKPLYMASEVSIAMLSSLLGLSS